MGGCVGCVGDAVICVGGDVVFVGDADGAFDGEKVVCVGDLEGDRLVIVGEYVV